MASEAKFGERIKAGPDSVFRRAEKVAAIFAFLEGLLAEVPVRPPAASRPAQRASREPGLKRAQRRRRAAMAVRAAFYNSSGWRHFTRAVARSPSRFCCFAETRHGPPLVPSPARGRINPPKFPGSREFEWEYACSGLDAADRPTLRRRRTNVVGRDLERGEV